MNALRATVNMPDNSTIAVLIATVAMLGNAIVVVFNGGFGLSGKLNKLERSHTAAITAMESRLAQTIAETARDLEDRQERLSGAFAESVKAVREQLVITDKAAMEERHQLSDQIRKVEIWVRDRFSEQDRETNAAIQSMRNSLMQLATGTSA